MAGVNSSGTAINKNAPSPQTGTALAEGDTKLVIQASSWPTLPPFRKGEAPTLLDAAEALKVKMFIENFLLNFTGVMRTGSPGQNKFEWVFNPWGNNLDLWIQTDLIHDRTPQLGGDLDVNRRDIFSRGAPLYLDARNAEPVFIVGSAGSHGELRFGGSNRNDYVGFKAGSAPTKIVWQLPNADGTTGQVLSTDGSKVLSWVNNSGGGGGSGTVTSVATSNGTFINITGGDPTPITTTGTISGDLSATGSASATTFLRGDNVWAVPAGTSPAGSTYELQLKAADGSFGAAGVFATTSGELQFGSASGTEAINLNVGDSIIDFGTYPATSFGQGIQFHWGYRICESPHLNARGLSFINDASGSDVLMMDIYSGVPYVGAASIRTVSFGHATHTENGNMGGGAVDVWPTIMLRGNDPAVNDNSWVQIKAQSGTANYTLGLPDNDIIGTSYRENMGMLIDSHALSTQSTSWKSCLIGNENGQSSEGSSGLFLKGYNAGTATDQTNAIRNGDKVYFSAGGSHLSIDYTTTGLGSGASLLHSFTINSTKSAIVKSVAPDSDAFVAVYCTESPEVRFEDVITIDVDGRRDFETHICGEFVFTCEPDSIQAIGHTTSEPALVGLKVMGGKLAVTFSELTDPPAQLVVHLSGIRSGAVGIRHGKKTRDQANWNNSFWQIASHRPELCPPLG